MLTSHGGEFSSSSVINGNRILRRLLRLGLLFGRAGAVAASRARDGEPAPTGALGGTGTATGGSPSESGWGRDSVMLHLVRQHSGPSSGKPNDSIRRSRLSPRRNDPTDNHDHQNHAADRTTRRQLSATPRNRRRRATATGATRPMISGATSGRALGFASNG